MDWKKHTITYRIDAAEMLYELWLNGITDNEVVGTIIRDRNDLIETGEVKEDDEIEDVDLVIDNDGKALITLTVEYPDYSEDL